MTGNKRRDRTEYGKNSSGKYTESLLQNLVLTDLWISTLSSLIDVLLRAKNELQRANFQVRRSALLSTRRCPCARGRAPTWGRCRAPSRGATGADAVDGRQDSCTGRRFGEYKTATCST
jgi:hypothetical protein